MPSETSWKLIISKKTGQWGIPYPGEQDDLARIDMKKETLKNTVDPFTITLEKRGGDAGVLKIAWEKTQASVDFGKDPGVSGLFRKEISFLEIRKPLLRC